MAVKKTTTKKSTTAASRTKAAPKKSAAAKKSASAPKAANVKKTTSAKKAAPKKAAAVKLTDKQLDLLKAVHGTKDQGYLADKKGEAKTLDALATKKLIKKGAKDKTSGHVRYHVSKTGEKHVSSSSPTA